MVSCTKYLADDNRKVTNRTGQSLPSNILCKPENDNLVKYMKT